MNATPPHDAKNRYLKDKSTEVTDSTLANYKTTLNIFCDWLGDRGILFLNTLTSDDIQQFKEWRGEGVKTITLKTDMTCIKGFVRFCEHINAVPDGLHMMVRVPKPNHEDEVASSILSRNEATAILAYLDKHEYASLRHVMFLLLWKTGMRRSALYALDVDDFDGGPKPHLRLRHRPHEGTPLKNKHRGERDVRISSETAAVISDFLKWNHPGAEDEYGRTALIMSSQGNRCEPSTIQRNIYTVTRPCHYTGECPLGRDFSECEATSYNTASKCPASVGPHALRRGYVTESLNAGQPKDVTADRVDMSLEVLDKHYDHATKSQKMERREDYLIDI
ncbi:tyrosine-type recombinase/integrase [Halomarina salina]|uniref:Tyrosine-type recombinase/integrase n=1 Tax=Halomarina salina TaxID=1872699 RepID=A0ABD5RKR8_9EURY|nr:tyrosine-type recombinase/integrase [Halomarina salina]